MKKTLPFVILIVSLIGCRKEKNRICELYQGSVGYAVGTIDYSTTIPGKTTYVYLFEVDRKEYKGKYKAYGMGQDDGRLIGRDFAVVYELSNPSNSHLNTSFYFESELDFQDFQDEYKDDPPDPGFPKNCK